MQIFFFESIILMPEKFGELVQTEIIVEIV